MEGWSWNVWNDIHFRKDHSGRHDFENIGFNKFTNLRCSLFALLHHFRLVTRVGQWALVFQTSLPKGSHALKIRSYGVRHGLRVLKRWQWCWWHRYVLNIPKHLVTLWWRLISDMGGRIIILATFSLCWWVFQCNKSVTIIFNLSPTHLVSNIRCNP